MAPLRSWLPSVLFAAAMSSTGVANAADAPSCHPFDRTPPCCPHAPPQCCPAPVSEPLDDASIVQLCGAATVKGENAGFNQCRRYFARGETVGQVEFGREVGDASTFSKLKASLGGARARVDAASFVGALQGFVVVEVDETGAPTRSSAWALVGTEILHVEAEREICDAKNVGSLMVRAIERLRHAPRPDRRLRGRTRHALTSLRAPERRFGLATPRAGRSGTGSVWR